MSRRNDHVTVTEVHIDLLLNPGNSLAGSATQWRFMADTDYFTLRVQGLDALNNPASNFAQKQLECTFGPAGANAPRGWYDGVSSVTAATSLMNITTSFNATTAELTARVRFKASVSWWIGFSFDGSIMMPFTWSILSVRAGTSQQH